MYAQTIEGEDWKGAMMDKAKIDKMSGKHGRLMECLLLLTTHL